MLVLEKYVVKISKLLGRYMYEWSTFAVLLNVDVFGRQSIEQDRRIVRQAVA